MMFFRRWRRRYFVNVRYLFRSSCFVCFLFYFFGFFFVILLAPNPFSSDYETIELRQDATWKSVAPLLEKKEDVLRCPLPIPEATRPLVILLYTTVFLQKRFCSFPSDRIFGQTCPHRTECQWTCDQRRLAEADAILFHAYDIQYYNAKIPQRSETKADSIWILWSDEPPSIIDYRLFQRVQFNWTMSYKMNSEISIGTYGLLVQRAQPWSEEMFQHWIDEEFARRRKGVLWFVSNCQAKDRLNYYSQMKQISSSISVEGYGRCVDSYPAHWCKARTQCEKNYMSQFQFYLSFESIQCQDYITEKFYKAFFHGLIPIVYGPKRRDYEQFAPGESFLHLNDVGEDIRTLMHRLETIAHGRAQFARYHRWRKDFEVIIDARALDRIRFCELCQRLRAHFSHPRPPSSVVQNLEEFFHQDC